MLEVKVKQNRSEPSVLQSFCPRGRMVKTKIMGLCLADLDDPPNPPPPTGDGRIEKIMNWDLSRVREYLINREGFEPSDVDKRIKEYRRFLVLVLMHGSTVPISEPVDVIWHNHILFTKDYMKMGNAVFGHYLHHHPTVNDEENIALAGNYKNNTLSAYQKLFGKVDRKYWPKNAQVCREDPDMLPIPDYPDPPETQRFGTNSGDDSEGGDVNAPRYSNYRN